MAMIQYVIGIRSIRQTIKEIETNVAYRWLMGFGFHTEVQFKIKTKGLERRTLETFCRQSATSILEVVFLYLVLTGSYLSESKIK